MSDLKPDSLEAFQRLLSEQTSYINEVDQQIAKWKQFQNDYQHLHARLSTLPDRLTYECMVPFGKLAFIPGRIIHSNELLVLLGDNYFVERSCKQAIEIVNRRLENIEDKVQKHEQERNVFNQQKTYTTNFLDEKTKYFEIKENDDNKHEKKTLNRRAQLTEEDIREERRRLQERAMKMNEIQTKHVHFEDNDNQIDVDSDDNNEISNEQYRKIFIRHTKTNSMPVGDPSPALFSHPGTIQPMAFTGKTIERDVNLTVPVESPKRISKFKASRQ